MTTKLVGWDFVLHTDHIYNAFTVAVPIFCKKDKPMGAVSTFTAGNYPRQPCVGCAFVDVCECFILKVKNLT